MTMAAQMDEYRRSRQEDKAKVLALMDSSLEEARQALTALRRKVANGKRNQ
jgi:hypothetical protein